MHCTFKNQKQQPQMNIPQMLSPCFFSNCCNTFTNCKVGEKRQCNLSNLKSPENISKMIIFRKETLISHLICVMDIICTLVSTVKNSSVLPIIFPMCQNSQYPFRYWAEFIYYHTVLFYIISQIKGCITRASCATYRYSSYLLQMT